MKKYNVSFNESMKNSAYYKDNFFEGDKKWDILRNLYEENYLYNQRLKAGNIPKIIHQIWFGSTVPERYAKWQESWKKYNPDWEYILWTDESIKNIKFVNEDIFKNTENYGAKSDIARYEILYQFGGLYVDTDFECLQSFEVLNSICDFYVGLFTSSEIILANGLIATIPKHPIIANCIKSIKNTYNSKKADFIFHATGPQLLTEVFLRHYDTDKKINIPFPASFFFPYPTLLRHIKDQKRIKKYIKQESYAIHYWDVSWQSSPKKITKMYSAIMRKVPLNLKSKIKNIIKWIRRGFSPIADPIFALKGLIAYPAYLLSWQRYSRLPGAERMYLKDAYPRLHDNTDTTGIDAHYFYTNGWAMRRILSQQPEQHVDIGSQTIFVNLLSAVVPVTFVDYRPMEAHLEGLTSRGGDILNLSFADKSIGSLSCLHVAEHIGLGRYGDKLNTSGTRQACNELKRILAPCGNLYFALPVGMPRLCFNAHRIHAVATILEYFRELKLMELSGVHDNGRFVERVEIDEFNKSDYACGLFWFKRQNL